MELGGAPRLLQPRILGRMVESLSAAATLVSSSSDRLGESARVWGQLEVPSQRISAASSRKSARTKSSSVGTRKSPRHETTESSGPAFDTAGETGHAEPSESAAQSAGDARFDETRHDETESAESSREQTRNSESTGDKSTGDYAARTNATDAISTIDAGTNETKSAEPSDSSAGKTRDSESSWDKTAGDYSARANSAKRTGPNETCSTDSPRGAAEPTRGTAEACTKTRNAGSASTTKAGTEGEAGSKT